MVDTGGHVSGHVYERRICFLQLQCGLDSVFAVWMGQCVLPCGCLSVFCSGDWIVFFVVLFHCHSVYCVSFKQ